MKYEKLISRLFAEKSNYNAQVAVALIAGLAAGAVLGILFAPASGEESRKRIADGAKNLGNGMRDGYDNLKRRIAGEEHEELAAETAVPHLVGEPSPKKRRSAIKDLVAEAQQNAEQA